MNRAGLAFAIIGGLIPAACGGKAGLDKAESWRLAESAADIAFADCDDQVDSRMQLHGFPARPGADTPQYRYRIAYMEKCMRDKGFEPE